MQREQATACLRLLQLLLQAASWSCRKWGQMGCLGCRTTEPGTSCNITAQRSCSACAKLDLSLITEGERYSPSMLFFKLFFFSSCTKKTTVHCAQLSMHSTWHPLEFQGPAAEHVGVFVVLLGSRGGEAGADEI